MSRRRKFMSHADVDQWFDPIRKCLKVMRLGEVDSYRGYPVTQLGWGDDWARIHECIAGWREAVARMLPDLDMAPFVLLENRLKNGVMLTHKDIDDGLALLNRAGKLLVKIPRQKVREAVNTQMIYNEMQSLGLVPE